MRGKIAILFVMLMIPGAWAVEEAAPNHHPAKEVAGPQGQSIAAAAPRRFGADRVSQDDPM